eukprot:2590997-Pleurochrysis_carterae.AAC.1
MAVWGSSAPPADWPEAADRLMVLLLLAPSGSAQRVDKTAWPQPHAPPRGAHTGGGHGAAGGGDVEAGGAE